MKHLPIPSPLKSLCSQAIRINAVCSFSIVIKPNVFLPIRDHNQNKWNQNSRQFLMIEGGEKHQKASAPFFIDV